MDVDSEEVLKLLQNYHPSVWETWADRFANAISEVASHLQTSMMKQKRQREEMIDSLLSSIAQILVHSNSETSSQAIRWPSYWKPLRAFSRWCYSLLRLYAWSRRGRQPTLLIVSIAFLVYFFKLIIEILPIGELHDDLVYFHHGLRYAGIILRGFGGESHRGVAKESENTAKEKDG